MRHTTVEIVDHGIYRWIKVVTEVKTNRTNWSLVARAETKGMRKVVEVAGPHAVRDVSAGLLVGLTKALEAGKRIADPVEHVAHIVKAYKRNAVADIGQG